MRSSLIPNWARYTAYIFALPNEVWRIQAMIDLWARPGPWSREKEREEGILLGYTDEQNNIWLSGHYTGPD
jgi:hypothetical protein